MSIDKTIQSNKNSYAITKQIHFELNLFKKLFDLYDKYTETNKPINYYLSYVLRNVENLSKTKTIKESLSQLFGFKEIKCLL